MRTRHDLAREGEVELVRVQGAINAEPLLAALRANGIAARLAGEALGSVYGLTLDGLGEVAVVVAKEDEAAARDLLAVADERLLAIEENAVEPILSNLTPPPLDDSE